jgi:hypothetical protein
MRPRSTERQKEKWAAPHEIQNHFFIATEQNSLQPWRSPPSLPHLIGTKNVFLAHLYTSNAK